jgi:hypothetical protein
MKMKVKKPSPPSVKAAAKAVKKAVSNPVSAAAKSVKQAGGNVKKNTGSIARGAKRIGKTVKPSATRAAKAIKQRSQKGIGKIKKAAKKAGKITALAAPGARDRYANEIRKAGTRQRITRANSRNVTTVRRIATGSHVVRYRNSLAKAGKTKVSSGKKLLKKAKKTFSKPGKPIAKAFKSPKKALSKKIKAASKAKVQFPKNVKGPKATCPLLKQKGLEQSNAMLKTPKLRIPKPSANVVGGIIGGVVGGSIGMVVGGGAGAVVGARVGARIVAQEFNKSNVVSRRTPDYSSKYRAGKPQPGNKTQRHTASTSVGVYPGQQQYNNCGVQSCAQIIAQATGTLPDEKVLLKFAIENGWAEKNGSMRDRRSIPTDSLAEPDGGTFPWTQKEILAAYGVSSKTYLFEYDNRSTLEKSWDDAIVKPISDALIKSTGEQVPRGYDVKRGTHTYRDTLGHAIWEGKGIITSIHTDGASWWKNWDGTSRGSGFHALCIVDGDFDANGNLTHVYLTDTGVNVPEVPPPRGQSRPGPKRVSIDEYMSAVQSSVDNGNPMSLVITDNKIWP